MKFRIIVLLLLVAPLFFQEHPMFADIGPKPTMEFTFKQNLPDELTITSGILYECRQPDCRDAAPLQDLGPQGFHCDATSCRAISYGFVSHHKLEIEFSDEVTRASNIFETVAFNSSFLVTINPDDLSVEAVSGSPAPSPEPFPEAPNPMPNVLIGLGFLLCIGLVLLLSIGLVIFFVRRSRTK